VPPLFKRLLCLTPLYVAMLCPPAHSESKRKRPGPDAKTHAITLNLGGRYLSYDNMMNVRNPPEFAWDGDYHTVEETGTTLQRTHGFKLERRVQINAVRARGFTLSLDVSGTMPVATRTAIRPSYATFDRHWAIKRSEITFGGMLLLRYNALRAAFSYRTDGPVPLLWSAETQASFGISPMYPNPGSINGNVAAEVRLRPTPDGLPIQPGLRVVSGFYAGGNSPDSFSQAYYYGFSEQFIDIRATIRFAW